MTHARSAGNAQRVVQTLNESEQGTVSSFVRAGFEAYVAILHPLTRCACRTVAVSQSYDEDGPSGSAITEETMRWSDVNTSKVPVVYGSSIMMVGGMPMGCPLQYRRLESGDWIVDRLEHGEGDVEGIIEAGDEWTYGPLDTLDELAARDLVTHPMAHT